MALSCSLYRDPYVYREIQAKQEMQKFIITLSQHAKSRNSHFVIIPQNGWTVYIQNTDAYESGAAPQLYMPLVNAIDGTGSEDLFYGANGNNTGTPQEIRNEALPILNALQHLGKVNLTVDYCTDPVKIADAMNKHRTAGRIPTTTVKDANLFPNTAPVPTSADSHMIRKLSDVAHYLYLLDPYDTLGDWPAIAAAVQTTYYDLILLDAQWARFNYMRPYIQSMKVKPNGSNRMVIAYCSIGEAENYRGYWQNDWGPNHPGWIAHENPDWEGNYKVRYWDPDWQDLVLNYIDQIIAAGFDGAYLDIVDAFEFFEEQEHRHLMHF